jgi:hypothetical protein
MLNEEIFVVALSKLVIKINPDGQACFVDIDKSKVVMSYTKNENLVRLEFSYWKRYYDQSIKLCDFADILSEHLDRHLGISAPIFLTDLMIKIDSRNRITSKQYFCSSKVLKR